MEEQLVSPELPADCLRAPLISLGPRQVIHLDSQLRVVPKIHLVRLISTLGLPHVGGRAGMATSILGARNQLMTRNGPSPVRELPRGWELAAEPEFQPLPTAPAPEMLGR